MRFYDSVQSYSKTMRADHLYIMEFLYSTEQLLKICYPNFVMIAHLIDNCGYYDLNFDI